MSLDSLFTSFKLDDESADRLIEILAHPKPPVHTGYEIREFTDEEWHEMALICNRQGAYEIAMERGDLELAARVKSGEVSDKECYDICESEEVEEDEEGIWSEGSD